MRPALAAIGRAMDHRGAALLLLVGAWLVVGLVSGIQHALLATGADAALGARALVVRQLLAALAWVPITLVVVILVRRIPIGGPRWLAALAVHGLAALLLGLVVNLLIASAYQLTGFVPPGPDTLWRTANREFARWAHVDVIVYGVIAAITYGLDRWRGTGVAHGQPRFPDRLTVRDGKGVRVVPTSEIAWIEGAGDYVRLHTRRGDMLATARLHALERQLDPSRFVRIHRSTIVNLQTVRAYRPLAHGGSTLTLTDGTRLRVSRRRRSSVRAALERVDGDPR